MDDIWSSLKSIIATVAPGIATALGGPLAGAAVAALGSALGLAPDTPPDQIAAAVAKADPATLAAIKQAEQTFLADMKRLDIDLEKVYGSDRDSARKRQVEVRDRAPAIIGGAVLLTWAGIQAYVFTHGIPPTLTEAIATRILGMLDAASLSVIYFYFGASNPNRAK
jgi:hypothetical protein